MFGRLIFWAIVIFLLYLAYQHFVGGGSNLTAKIASYFHSTTANITR
jgi:hypothetical protein